MTHTSSLPKLLESPYFAKKILYFIYKYYLGGEGGWGWEYIWWCLYTIGKLFQLPFCWYIDCYTLFATRTIALTRIGYFHNTQYFNVLTNWLSDSTNLVLLLFSHKLSFEIDLKVVQPFWKSTLLIKFLGIVDYDVIFVGQQPEKVILWVNVHLCWNFKENR